MRLPPLMIQGFSVRDYAYQWICGGCPIHQWSSGARGINRGVIQYVKDTIVNAHSRPATHRPGDVEGLVELLRYLIFNEGHPAEKYIPNEHGYEPVEAFSVY